MTKIFGIVNLHYDEELASLTSNRPLASVAFLGRYTFVDLALSNFANSGVEELGVLIQNKPRSLLKHFGFEHNEWLRNSKTGKMILMYNESQNNNPKLNHAFNNLVENAWALKDSKAEYVAIAPAHIVMRLDFREMVKTLKRKKADIVVGFCDPIKVKEPIYYSFNEKGELKGVGEEPTKHLCIHVFLLKRQVLQEMIKNNFNNANKIYDLNWFNATKDKYRVVGYKYRGFISFVESIQDYYNLSMELLKPRNTSKLFVKDWPIYTRTYNTPPTYYGHNVEVKDSLIANGGFIKGTVINSILGRDVTVGEGAVITDSILFSRCNVEAGAKLTKVICDKSAQITKDKVIKGTSKNPFIVKQEEIV